MKLYFKELIPHFLFIVAFVAYVSLGAVGFYYLIRSHQQQTPKTKIQTVQTKSSWNKTDEATELSTQMAAEDEEGDDCVCKTKLIIERSVHDEETQLTMTTTVHPTKKKNQEEEWTFVDALTLSFYHMTTVGRLDYYFDSNFVKVFVLTFSFFGVLLAFLTFADMSYLFHEAVYIIWNCCRRCSCRRTPVKKVEYAPVANGRRFSTTRSVNPLVFVGILFVYCISCSVCFAYLSSSTEYFEYFFDCFLSIFGLSPKTSLILPKRWFFVQLLYVFLGLVIVGALLRSLLPVVWKINQLDERNYSRMPDNNKDTVHASARLLYSIASESIPYADENTSVITVH